MKTSPFSQSVVSAMVLAVAVAFQSCSSEPQPIIPSQQDQLYSALKEVIIDTATESPIKNQLLVTGKIVADENRQIKIFPQVSGTVTAVHVHSGYYVKAGQVLAELRSSEMANFNSELSGAEASVASARRDLSAKEDMFNGGLVSAKEVEEARNEFKRVSSELQRAEQVLQINGGDRHASYKIKSAISGFVIDKKLTDHMQLRPDNADPVFVIADISNVWAMINIYESDISFIHQGDSVALTTLSYPGKTFYGTIDKIYQMLDPETKTMRAKINIRNEDLLLKPEMFVTAKVRNEQRGSSLSISDKALIFDNDKYYVVVRTPDGPEVKRVTIAEKLNGRAYISEGLKSGDQVVCSRQLYFFEALK